MDDSGSPRLRRCQSSDPLREGDGDIVVLLYAYFYAYFNLVNIAWDRAKADENLFKHQIAFADAELVLSDSLALTKEDPDAEGEQRFLSVGGDAFGRILAVIYAYRGEGRIRLISARRATNNE